VSAKFRKFELIAGSRSSKVIDLGVNRKPMYDFLLVTYSNFGRICYRFSRYWRLKLDKKAQLWLRNPRDATAFQIHQEEIHRN